MRLDSPRLGLIEQPGEMSYANGSGRQGIKFDGTDRGTRYELIVRCFGEVPRRVQASGAIVNLNLVLEFPLIFLVVRFILFCSRLRFRNATGAS